MSILPLQRRLDIYWKMEAGCAALIPLVAAKFAAPETPPEWSVLGLSLAASCALLCLGAAYWKARGSSLRGDQALLSKVVSVAHRAQPVLLIVSLVCVAASITMLVLQPSRTNWLSLSLSALAFLEYVNYFHLQLQNFDHLPDLMRLLKTRRLREVHLAADLVTFRKKIKTTVQHNGR